MAGICYALSPGRPKDDGNSLQEDADGPPYASGPDLGADLGRAPILALLAAVALALLTMPASAQLLGPAIQAELARAAGNANSAALKQRLQDINAFYAKSLYTPIWIIWRQSRR